MNNIDFLVSLGFLVLALINGASLIVVNRTNKNMVLLEKNTNSKMDELIASTAKASLAEGNAAGLERGRNEQR
jgi:hypothetical protein